MKQKKIVWPLYYEFKGKVVKKLRRWRNNIIYK